MWLKIKQSAPEMKKIDKVVEVLKQGGIIVYPTDTIYGLGCDIFNKKAVNNIYQLKKRDKKKPLSIICFDFQQISEYAKIPNYAFRLMKKSLPGPYTFVLQAKNKTPSNFISAKKTVGIRIPDNQICLSLVKKLGNPIITTSLNLTGEQVLTNPDQLDKELINKIDLIIDAGNLNNEASTIIDLTNDQPVLIRKGLGNIENFNF